MKKLNLEQFIENSLSEFTTELTSEELNQISGGGCFGLQVCCIAFNPEFLVD